MDESKALRDDADRKKGAVERAPDAPSAPPRDEQGRPPDAIAVTKNVTDASSEEIEDAKEVLGADENGTPG